MAKDQPHDAKNEQKRRFFNFDSDLFCTESILLRGTSSAVLHGCGRILFYGRECICFSMKEKNVSVWGRELSCTVFSPTGVTVEGTLEGVRYCHQKCTGKCAFACREEGER